MACVSVFLCLFPSTFLLTERKPDVHHISLLNNTATSASDPGHSLHVDMVNIYHSSSNLDLSENLHSVSLVRQSFVSRSSSSIGSWSTENHHDHQMYTEHTMGEILQNNDLHANIIDVSFLDLPDHSYKSICYGEQTDNLGNSSYLPQESSSVGFSGSACTSMNLTDELNTEASPNSTSDVSVERQAGCEQMDIFWPSKVEMVDKNIISPLNPIKTFINGMAIFVCEVASDELTVRWLKENEPIQADSKYILTEMGRMRSLTISCVQASDEGMYTVQCGEHTSSALLQVRGLFLSRDDGGSVFI